MFSTKLLKEIYESDIVDYSIYYDNLSNLDILKTPLTTTNRNVGVMVREMIEVYLKTKFNMDNCKIKYLIETYPLELTYVVTYNIMEGMDYKEIFDKDGIKIVEDKE